DLMAQLRAKVGAPTGTVQVAAAPPMMWPSELRAPDRAAEPMVPVPAPPVPAAIARPLETAVVPVRAPYTAPAPTGPHPSSATPAVTAVPAAVPEAALGGRHGAPRRQRTAAAARLRAARPSAPARGGARDASAHAQRAPDGAAAGVARGRGEARVR